MKPKSTDESLSAPVDRPFGKNDSLVTYRSLLQQCVHSDDPIKTISSLATIWDLFFTDYPISRERDEEQAMSMYDPFDTYTLLESGVLLECLSDNLSLSIDDVLLASSLSKIFVLTSQICPGYDIWKRTIGNIEAHIGQRPEIIDVYQNLVLNIDSWQHLPDLEIAECLNDLVGMGIKEIRGL